MKLDDLLADAIERNVRDALAEDIGGGDITALLIPLDTRGRAFVITREAADAYREAQKRPEEVAPISIPSPDDGNIPTTTPTQPGLPLEGAGGQPVPAPFLPSRPSGVRWTGEIPAQKWMNFYTKVLTRLGVQTGLKLTVGVEYQSAEPMSPQKVEEVRSALRELGLSDKLE